MREQEPLLPFVETDLHSCQCGRVRDQELRLNGQVSAIKLVCCQGFAEAIARKAGQSLTGQGIGGSGTVYTAGEHHKYKG